MSTPANPAGPESGPHTVPDQAPVTQQIPAYASGTTDTAGSDPDAPVFERDEFGGVKVGSAFFGWVVAAGMTVLLGAVAGGIGFAVFGQGADLMTVASNMNTIGLVGGIAMLVILLLAYFCGGYVAARMARFHGARQGVAVWVWAIVITLVLVVVGYVAGPGEMQTQVEQVPEAVLPQGDVATVSLVVAGVIALTSLLGAVLGGLAGMGFHRRVDRAGLRRQ